MKYAQIPKYDHKIIDSRLTWVAIATTNQSLKLITIVESRLRFFL